MPSFDALVRDIGLVRENGLTALRRIKVPALRHAVVEADLEEDLASVGPAAIEQLLRLAVDTLGGGLEQESTEILLGLAPGTKMAAASERRRLAAKRIERHLDTFRKVQEKEYVEQVAEGVLAMSRDARMRRTHHQMQRRHPADSRLAVAWVERFEAYYRIWTPAYALGADLYAALVSAREQPQVGLPWDPESPYNFDPDAESRAYALSALYRYAQFNLELKRFMNLRGGLWLFSDTTIEQQVADAVYRIGWHNDLNADEDSWLRRMLADSRYEEMEAFKQITRATDIGQRIEGDWLRFIARCDCADIDSGHEHCQVHSTIRATEDYCRLVDEDWIRIADWYRPGSQPGRGVSGAELYRKQIAGENGQKS